MKFLALLAACIFPLWLYASLCPANGWSFFSLMRAKCLDLRTSAAMTDGSFPPVQAVFFRVA